MQRQASHQLSIALVLLFSGSGAAEIGAREDDETTRSQSQASPDPTGSPSSSPPVSVEEYVFVEGSLPYVPRSSSIVTKLPLDLRSTPANVGFVTEPVAREQFDRVLGDALKNVSNVNVQTQNGVSDFFYIRGFDSLSSGLVLTDGAPEPEATRYQLYNVELIEVLKGPGGFLYGSNPLAGTVNLVRKQPVPASLLDLTATAGSYGLYEGSFDWNQGAAERNVLWRLNGLLRSEGSYRDGKEGRTAAINPAVSVRLGDAGRVNVNFEYLDVDVVPDAGIPVTRDQVLDVDRATNYQSPLDDSQQQILRFQADTEWRFTERFALRDKFYTRTLDWETTGTLLNGVLPTGPASLGVIRTLAALDDRQSFVGNQVEAVLDVDTGPVRHSLLAGLEIDRFGDRFVLDASLLPIVDAYEPVEPPGATPFPLPGASQAGDARSIVAAPYVVDQLRFGPRFRVLFGARLDAIDFEDTVRKRSRSDSEASPMAGVLFAATPELSFYGNYSRAFAPPSPRVSGELVPERGVQYELGVKKRFSTLRAETTFAVYQLDRENIAIPDDNGFSQQAGNQRSKGFELDVAAEPSRGFRTFFSYAFNDSELTRFRERLLVSLDPPLYLTLDRSGNRPAFAPENLMNLWVSKDLTSRWGVGGGARYVGAQFIAEDNAFRIDGVLTFDAMVSCRLGGVTVRLNLKNLTNREYFLRGFGGSSVIPAPPFTAFVGLDYEM